MKRTSLILSILLLFAGGVVGDNQKNFNIFNYELGMKIEDVPCEFSLEYFEIVKSLPPFYSCNQHNSSTESLDFLANPETKEVYNIMRKVLLNENEQWKFIDILIDLYGKPEQRLPGSPVSNGINQIVWGNGIFKYFKSSYNNKDTSSWGLVSKDKNGEVLHLRFIRCEDPDYLDVPVWLPKNDCNETFEKADSKKNMAYLTLFDEAMRKSANVVLEKRYGKKQD